MKALLIFGQKFGEDNPALIKLGDQIKALGVEVAFARWDDKDFDLLGVNILGGHSYGFDTAMDLAKQHPEQTFDYVIGIDGVSRGWFPCFIWNFWKKWTMPWTTVTYADFFQRSGNLLPPSGSIGNPTRAYVNFLGIKATHAEIPNHPFVVDLILTRIKALLGNTVS